MPPRSRRASDYLASRSAEVEGRASLLLLPQQRRCDARAAGRGAEGLRHRHVARRHARLPEAAVRRGIRTRRRSGFDDKALARVQFASALAVAERHGKAASTDLEAAAKLLVADQKADGSWRSISRRASARRRPTGPIIATWSARSTLIASGMQPDNFTIVQADRWIRGLDARERPRCVGDDSRAGARRAT